MIQLPQLLYAIAEHADGRSDYEQLAERVSADVGRGVSGDNVRFLVDERLRPLGVLAQADGSSPRLRKPDPLLALKFRAAVVPEWLTRALTTVFLPFFFPPVIVAVLAALVAVDVWFFFVHGAAQSTRELLYNPVLLLMVLGLVVLATALHEIGHATALRYGGGRPGVMGAGIYIVWPAFYTDVTDGYRLDRAGRLRTDLGGVYFNCIFVLGIVGAYALTGFEPLLILVIVQHLQMLQQFLPFLRLDGYYILSDLTGVPDMFNRIKPTLRSALPGRETDARVEELKPWVRWVTTGWIALLAPVLLFTFGMLIFNAPRMFATAWDSLWVQVDKIRDGGGLEIVAGAIQTTALVLPLAGITYTFGRIGGRLSLGAWRWSEGHPVRRAGVALVGAAAAAAAAFVLLPNGEYRPIQPGERGTVQGGVAQLAAFTTGRPGLTEERKAELGGAPTERERRDTGPSESNEEDTRPSGDEPSPAPPSDGGESETPGTATGGAGDSRDTGTATAPGTTTAAEPGSPTETTQTTGTTDTTETTEATP